MRIAEAARTIRNARYDCAVYLASVGAKEVDVLRLNDRSKKRKLDGWLRDKYFLRNFVGVYDHNTTLEDLQEDVRFAAQRQAP